MYKGYFPKDQSGDKAVERRRAAETARKARIFNTKQRVIGLDLDTLNKQVQEKKHLQDIQRQQDEAFGKQRESQGVMRKDSAELQPSLTQQTHTNHPASLIQNISIFLLPQHLDESTVCAVSLLTRVSPTYCR